MQNTPNYNLNKPDGNDFAKIQSLNENADIIDATLKSLADISIDFEYQTPTISGAQLQIVKNSETKRLFIRLNNDLNGNITISLDGGGTSRPLLDVDGQQVTSIEKGFVEVVEDTTFFTLRNRGVSATDLRELIDLVNEAERNESVLKSQFATAVNEVDLFGGINLPTDATWANILGEIPNIKNGKYYATGTVTQVTSTTGDYEVNGLNFVPKAVFLMYSLSPNTSQNNLSVNTLSLDSLGNVPTWVRIYSSNIRPEVATEPTINGFRISRNGGNIYNVRWVALENIL